MLASDAENGHYGLVRFCVPLFPNARRLLIVDYSAGITGIVYGALVAMVQPNMKNWWRNSSVSHLGFVVLGVFPLHKWEWMARFTRC